jgi:hypothetical protein
MFDLMNQESHYRKQTLKTAARASEFVKGCQMPAHIAMHWQDGTGFRGQASDKPRGTKPRGVGRVFQCAGMLWGFEWPQWCNRL